MPTSHYSPVGDQDVIPVILCAFRPHRPNADRFQLLLVEHTPVASNRCPSLGSKRVSPRELRHSAVMELLHAGVDCSIITLWLGYESSTRCRNRQSHSRAATKLSRLRHPVPLGTSGRRPSIMSTTRSNFCSATGTTSNGATQRTTEGG
jgi:hypothetical protein